MTYTGPIPFEEAMAAAKRKGILRTTLPSRELSALDGELKRRSIFSAQLDVFNPLQSLKTNLEKIAEGGVDEYDRIRSIPEAKAQLREAMREAGMMPAPSGTREIKDFYSDARRQLMVETNVLDTLNFGRWKATQDQVALDVNPAWELVRMIETRVQRDWEERWIAAAEATGGFDGCTDPRESGGRMVALKNHPIWQALGDGEGGYDDTLGNPWPPFAFNSGMNVIDVSRDDAVALGIMEPDDTVEPSDDHDLNESLEASAARFDGELQAALADDDGLEISDGVLRLKNRRQRLCNMGTSEGAYKGWAARRGHGATSTPKAAERQRIVKEVKAGRAALKKARSEKNDQNAAMHVPGLGSIDFDYGHPGSAKATKEDGYGVAHMELKHGAELRRMPVTIARGKVYRHESPVKRYIVHGDHIAVVRQKQLHPRLQGQQTKFSGKRWGVTTHYRDANKARRIESTGLGNRRQMRPVDFLSHRGYTSLSTIAAIRDGCRQRIKYRLNRLKFKSILARAGGSR